MVNASDDAFAWRQLFPALDRADAALQAQIRRSLVAAIESRYLSPGTRLPSSRRLSEILNVARNTVVFAYERLVDEGYLVSHERSGVFVAAEGVTGERSGTPRERSTIDWPSRFAVRPSAFQHIVKPRHWQSFPYPFLFGQFDPALFPTANWRESVAAASSVSSINEWAGDLIDEDDPELLAQLRSQVLPRRGVWAAEGEAMITIGAQLALYLIVRLLVGTGDRVAVEDPGYPDTRNMIELAGARAHPMLVDREGADPGEDFARCRVAFVTPGHQCPTTAVMPLARRRAVLAAARRHDVMIVEDDYDADLTADSSRVPPVKSLDTDGRVIYIGSLSKALAPGLRLGYIVAPAPVINELRVLRRLMLRHPPSNNQRAMAMFIALGHYRGHLTRLAETLDARAAIVETALGDALPNFSSNRGAGGCCFWIAGPDGFDARAAAARAQDAGVLIEPGDVFFARPEDGRSYFRLGFSSIRTERIAEGLHRLARAIG